jgi:hypothetical protein
MIIPTPPPGRLRAALAALAALSALAALPAGPAQAARLQHADVHPFASLPDVVDVGDATLVRTHRGIHARLRTHALPPGPHTLWWIVWNNAEACGDDGCTDADLGAPGVDADIGYADGAVVHRNGRAQFAATLREGRPLTGFPPELGLTSGSGLIDARTAEVHLVVRSHGPSIRGIVRDMTHTLHGGCDYSVFGGVVPEGAYGIPGPNTCTEMQFAVFPG